MYCKRCGKYIESGTLCPECISEEVVFGKEVEVKPYEEKIPSRKAGLNRAIIGATFGVVAVIYAVLTLVFVGVIGAFDYASYDIPDSLIIFPTVICASSGAVFTIMGAIFGVKSVVFAFRRRKSTGTLPIATLILGFVAIGCCIAAATMIFYAGGACAALVTLRN